MYEEMKGLPDGRKDELSENPKGTEKKMEAQREKERHGYFVIVNCKPATRIFVRDGEDEQERINAYLEKVNNRPKKWN